MSKVHERISFRNYMTTSLIIISFYHHSWVSDQQRVLIHALLKISDDILRLIDNKKVAIIATFMDLVKTMIFFKLNCEDAVLTLMDYNG